MTPEQISAFILELQKALADNVLSVKFEGKETTFDSADQIIRRIKYFKAELKSLNGKSGGPKRTTIYTTSRKGL